MSLLTFPCEFSLKIMGKNIPGFVTEMVEFIEAKHSAPKSHKYRESKDATYVSLTAIVDVNSQAELDSLYQALHGHPAVKMLL